MDKSKIYQTEIPVSSNIGEITINSYTGRLLVNIPDMAVGVASTAMGISHVYNDHMVAGSSDFLVPEAMKEYNVGKNWKLSCQQKVIYLQNYNRWYYIDAIGRPCRMTKENDATWYETDNGYGLTMKKTNLTNKSFDLLITDNTGNEMRFKNKSGDGKVWLLCESRRCTKFTYNEENREYITYDYEYDSLGRLINVSSPDNALLPCVDLMYNTNGRLETMCLRLTVDEGSGTERLKRIFEYDTEGNLISIREKAGESERGVATIGYNTDKSYGIRYIIDESSRETVCFERNTSFVTKVSQGKTAREHTPSTTYVGEDTYSGTAYLQSPEKAPTFEERYKEYGDITIDYVNNGYTKLTASTGKTMEYYHNGMGETYDICEDGKEAKDPDQEESYRGFFIENATGAVRRKDIKEVTLTLSNSRVVNIPMVFALSARSEAVNYITENDLTQTLFHMRFGKKIFVYCGGRKRVLGVDKITIGNGFALETLDLDAKVYKENQIEYTVKGAEVVLNTQSQTKFDVSSLDSDLIVLYNDTIGSRDVFHTEDEEGNPVDKQVSHTTRVRTISDMLGRVLESTDEYGVKTVYEYDKYGNLTKRIRTSTKDNANEQIVEYEATYNAFGRLLSERDSLGVVTKYVSYSVMGEIETSYVEGDTQRKRYTYDDFGNLSEIITETYDESSDSWIVAESNKVHYGIGGDVMCMRNGELKHWFGYNDYSDLVTYRYDRVPKYKLTRETLYDDGTSIYRETIDGQLYVTETDRQGRVKVLKVDGDQRLATSYDQSGTYEIKTETEEDSNTESEEGTSTDTESEEGTSTETEKIAVKKDTLYERENDVNIKTTTHTYDEDGIVNRLDVSGLINYTIEQSNGVQAIQCKKDVNYGQNVSTIFRTLKDTSILIQPRDLEAIVLRLNNNGISYETKRKYSYDDYGRGISTMIYSETLTENGEKKYQSNPLYEYKCKYTLNSDKIEQVELVEYEWVNTSDNVDEPTQKKSNVYTPVYDQAGRLSSLTTTTKVQGSSQDVNHNYIYDDLGRLSADGQYSYTYADGNLTTVSDSSGNVCTYDYSLDKLIAMTNGESTKYFQYDQYGYPTHYKVSSLDTQPNMAWDMGSLKSYGDVTYKYDAKGIRLEKKSANGTVHKYFTHNGKILAEEIGSDMQIAYLYAGDSPDSMCVSQTQGFAVYNLVKDMLGNVVALIDDKGNRLASYEYDAWGNVSTYDGEGNRLDYATNPNHIAFVNPFRYRGYYYDDETGLYYLQTRYYDPETRRFISPDTYDYLDSTSTHGLNLYLYCGNDPVNYYDPTGHFWLGALIGAIVGFIATAAVDLLDDGELFNGSVSAEAYVANTVVGAVAGATMATVAPMSFTASIPTITATGTGALAVATATVTVTGTQVATVIGATVASASLGYVLSGKRIAPRNNSSTRKEARDKAYHKGGKKKPIGPEDHGFGKHFHPNVPEKHPFRHWHYYFKKSKVILPPIIMIDQIFGDE